MPKPMPMIFIICVMFLCEVLFLEYEKSIAQNECIHKADEKKKREEDRRGNEIKAYIVGDAKWLLGKYTVNSKDWYGNCQCMKRM